MSKPYNAPQPCHNCPFLRVGHIPLTPGRVREISRLMCSSNGGEFPCHKTTISSRDGGECVSTTDSLHCAGALIYAEKNGNATQMMRIAERLGMYDPQALMSDARVVALVFDDEQQMLDGHARSNRRDPGAARTPPVA
jgi:hypothetical protein